jgi:hypothetical protein
MTDRPPPHWDDLSDAQKVALIEAADTRLFWQNAGRRLAWLKVPASVILALAAAWSVIGEGLAHIIIRMGEALK